MSKKKRSASSTRWLQEHINDVYVQKANKLGLRSRAWFKLEELDQKDRIFKPNMNIVDLGASPGGWSQYAVQKILPNGQIFACDILPLDAIINVNFIQGDFREESVFEQLMDSIGERSIDVVMSDMSPNLSGMSSVDIPRAMYLSELALEMCEKVLNKNGSFIAKIFQGSGFDEYIQQLRKMFKVVKIRKPDASRSRSREVYVVAQQRKI